MGEGETGGPDVPGDEPTVPSEPYEPEPYEPGGPDEFEGAPDDEELPLTEHIEEMLNRLLVVLGVMAVASAIVFPFAEHIINFLWYTYLPTNAETCAPGGPNTYCPRVYHPLGLILARLKVSTLAGFVVALPVLVYESYLFMRPGLYPRERRYYLASVPTSLILAVVGLLFAHLVVLPAIFTYFLYYTEGAAEIAFSLSQTFELMVMMLGFFAFIFQIPLFIMLAIMMGVTSRRWLAARRLYFWAGFATIAFIFNPDPTGMAPFIVTATMIALFEGTLALLYWTGEGSIVPSLETATAARPYVWGLTALSGYVVSSAPMPRSYFDLLPETVVDLLANLGVAGYLPALVAIVLIAVYETVLYLVRQRMTDLRLWLRIRQTRIPAWLGAVAIGYFASPEPPLLDSAVEVAVPPIQVAGVVLGIVAAFEIALGIWRWRRPDY